MFGVWIYDLIFFGIRVALVCFWAISLYRYLSAKKKNRAVPGSVSDSQLKTRKILLILSSVLAGVLVAIVLGFVLLLYTAVAFM